MSDESTNLLYVIRQVVYETADTLSVTKTLIHWSDGTGVYCGEICCEEKFFESLQILDNFLA